jgi:hypothetical protein
MQAVPVDCSKLRSLPAHVKIARKKMKVSVSCQLALSILIK